MAKHDHVSAEFRRRLHDRRCEPACPDLAMRISVASFCGAAKRLAEAELGFLREKAWGLDMQALRATVVREACTRRFIRGDREKCQFSAKCYGKPCSPVCRTARRIGAVHPAEDMAEFERRGRGHSQAWKRTPAAIDPSIA